MTELLCGQGFSPGFSNAWVQDRWESRRSLRNMGNLRVGRVWREQDFHRCNSRGLRSLVRLDAALSESALPDIKFGFEAEGESALDELHDFFDGDIRRWGDEQMNVVGHDDEGVELISTFEAVFVEEIYEKCGVGFGLEESTTVCGYGGDEKGSQFLQSERHWLGV